MMASHIYLVGEEFCNKPENNFSLTPSPSHPPSCHPAQHELSAYEINYLNLKY